MSKIGRLFCKLGFHTFVFESIKMTKNGGIVLMNKVCIDCNRKLTPFKCKLGLHEITYDKHLDDYVLPSKKALNALNDGIESAKNAPVVYRSESFLQYANLTEQAHCIHCDWKESS